MSEPAPLRPVSTSVAITRAARKLFAETDPRRITVRQIAMEAHVSIGSVYVHFGSKDGLYLSILGDALKLSASYTMNRTWDESPLQRVFNAGDEYIRFATENPEAFRVILQRTPIQADTPALADTAQRLERLAQREATAIMDDLQAAMDAGEMVQLPVVEVLAYLWASWAGVLGMVIREDRFRISVDEARRILRGAQFFLARGIHP
jgi:TetR/AcrR family transcriptional regulator